jgi:trans-4-hydroxy-L-proline dehydratase
VARGAAEQNATRERRAQRGGKPLQSVFTRDCIARGADIDRGGARYNWVECSFVGMANLVDSLEVIRHEVFEDRRLSFAELKAILDADFEGHEAWLSRFQRHAKYGNDQPAVDALVARTTAFLKSQCARHRMQPDDSPYVPGMFCWIMHERLGRECGATPDGRRAGFPFADGAGPAQGRERRGPTAAILSTTSWDHAPMMGGTAYNMKFAGDLFSNRESYRRLHDLVVTFLRRGGLETQINVVNRQVLEQARAHPDAYRDLVVRIGGYTDYFTRLSPEMQAEVILRTGFESF